MRLLLTILTHARLLFRSLTLLLVYTRLESVHIALQNGEKAAGERENVVLLLSSASSFVGAHIFATKGEQHERRPPSAKPEPG